MRPPTPLTASVPVATVDSVGFTEDPGAFVFCVPFASWICGRLMSGTLNTGSGLGFGDKFVSHAF